MSKCIATVKKLDYYFDNCMYNIYDQYSNCLCFRFEDHIIYAYDRLSHDDNEVPVFVFEIYREEISK